MELSRRILPARSNPSISGIITSSSARSNGRWDAPDLRMASRAAVPPSAETQVAPQLAMTSSRIRRLVWLSSTISTCRPGILAVLRGSSGEGSLWRPSRSVKEKTLPRPTSESTRIVPPMSWTNWAEIVKPSPVPPNLRVVEPSTCSKGSKIVLSFFCRNADASIGYGNPHDHLVLRPQIAVQMPRQSPRAR